MRWMTLSAGQMMRQAKNSPGKEGGPGEEGRHWFFWLLYHRQAGAITLRLKKTGNAQIGANAENRRGTFHDGMLESEHQKAKTAWQKRRDKNGKRVGSVLRLADCVTQETQGTSPELEGRSSPDRLGLPWCSSGMMRSLRWVVHAVWEQLEPGTGTDWQWEQAIVGICLWGRPEVPPSWTATACKFLISWAK